MPEDERAQHWLDLLRDGTPEQQALARTELGLIFESRGMLEEAAEAYWMNVKAQVRDRRPYRRLAAIYRQRGDALAEARILVLMSSVFAPERESRARPRRSGLGRVRLAFLGMLALAALAGIAFLLRQSETIMTEGDSASKAIDDAYARGLLPIGPQSTRIPAWCSDAGARFPEWLDPEGAVLEATARPWGADVLQRSTEFVAQWIAVRLYQTHHGQPSPTLADIIRIHRGWMSIITPGVRQSFEATMLHNFGLRLPPLFRLERWTEMQSWPADSCDGAFLNNADKRLVRLIRSSFGDWADESKLPYPLATMPSVGSPAPAASPSNRP